MDPEWLRVLNSMQGCSGFFLDRPSVLDHSPASPLGMRDQTFLRFCRNSLLFKSVKIMYIYQRGTVRVFRRKERTKILLCHENGI